VEMGLGAKQKVAYYSLKLGDFFMKANLYVMILGSYDIVIGMD
jgi:hypothetical protein